MKIRRMMLLAVVAEVIAILVLVLLVSLFGPSEASEARAFADRLGTWVGPIAGFVLCFGGGWLVARGMTSGHVLRGLLFGAMVAMLDGGLLVLGGAAFQPILVVSNVGRLVAGALGGLVARGAS